MSQLEDIMADTDGPYWKAAHPEHRATVERVAELLNGAPDTKPAIDPMTGESNHLGEVMNEALSAPPDIAEYDWSGVREFEGENWTPEAEQTLGDWFRDLGVSVAQQRSVTQRYQEVATMTPEQRGRMADEATTSLQSIWGKQFDHSVAVVERLIDRMGPNFRQTLIDSGLNNDVATINSLYGIARSRGITLA